MIIHRDPHHETVQEPSAPKKVEITAPVAPQMPTVTEAELNAAYEEFIHGRNAMGDGCPACGYGAWWNRLNVKKPFHLTLLKNVLEAAKKALIHK